MGYDKLLTLSRLESAVCVCLELEREFELLRLESGEALQNHLGVGVDDAV